MRPVTFLLIVIFYSTSSSFLTLSQERKVGDTIPSFSLINDVGEVWSFPKDLEGEFAVFFFYPAAMTGGCTNQACSYRDLQTDFSQNGTQIIGISGDSPDNLKIFRKAHGLNFPLLSDGEGKIAHLFGVPTRDGGSITRDIEGKEVILKRNITTDRWTFIVSRSGKVLQAEKVTSPASDGQKAKQYILNYINN
jgi:thioredoxin-dependent peroxiredoxin